MSTVTLLLLFLSILLAGCNPYMMAASAVSQTYNVATDDRSVSTQASDTEIVGKIKASLVASPVEGTDSINVFCQRGVVVLAGAVPPGSEAGRAAVRIARETAGVRRVETFYVESDPSDLGDIELKAKIKERLIADPDITAGQVDIGVYGGHVVLVGVVSSWEQSEQFVADARSVSGVVSVRSYIQVGG